MARSSSNDPAEKFRFLVTMFSNDAISGGFTTGSGSSLIGFTEDKGLFTRAGFSEVTAPKATIKDIPYRENINGNDMIKVPGLVTYDPVTMRRGVSNQRDLYNWYKQVNNSAASLNKFAEGLAGFSAIPFQKPNYRREVLISSMDRTGKFVKHWLLYNAWPIGYKGASDFNASASEILLEEVIMTYETFLECKGNSVIEALNDAKGQAEIAAQQAAGAALIGGFTGLFG